MKLTNGEISWLVNNYIGVQTGYLGDFSYRTHNDFYPTFCGLDIDTYEIRGDREITTRYLFEEILQDAAPFDQAKILEGVLDKYPPDSSREAMAGKIRGWIDRLRSATIETTTIQFSYENARAAMESVERALLANDPVAAIDRVHTVLHGYLKDKCGSYGIPTAGNPSMTSLVKQLRRHNSVPGEVQRTLTSLASAVQDLNEVRNNNSLAHPTQDVLDKAEAMLAVNAAKTILVYLNERLQ